LSELLLEIQAGDQLSSGIFPGLPGEAPILWADGENIVFDSGQVKKSPGFTRLDTDTNFAATPSDLITAKTSAERRAYIGAGGSIYAYRTADDVTQIGSGFSAGGRWVLIPWGNWLFGTNDTTDGLQIWKHTENVLDTSPASVTTPFTRCKTLAKLNNSLIAFNTSNSPYIAEYCDSGNPETGWTPTLTGSAGNLELRDLDSDVIAVCTLAGGLGVYTGENLSLFRFVGGTLRFGWKVVLESVGAVSPRSVVSTGNYNYGITKDFVFVTDGNSFTHIHEPAVKGWLDENVDWSRKAEVYGYHDKQSSSIVWLLPMVSGGMKGIVYRYSKGSWTKLAADMVVGAEYGVWDEAFTCDSTGIYRQEKNIYNKGSSPLVSYVYTKPLDCGDRRRLKFFSKLELDIQKTGTVTAYASYNDKPDDTLNWESLGTVDNELWMHREAPFVSIKLEAAGLNSQFKLNGAKLHGSFTGWLN